MENLAAPGIKLVYYATIAGDKDLKTLGGTGRGARKIRVGVAGNLVLVNQDGVSTGVMPVDAGEEIVCWINGITASGTTATQLKVYW